MLVYNPAFDIHHGIFRLLQVLSRVSNDEIELDKVLILDFYILFPNKLFEARLTTELRRTARETIQVNENPYKKVGNTKLLFNQMRNYQLAALACLASYGLIDNDKLQNGSVNLLRNNITQEMKTTLDSYYAEHAGVVDFITKNLAAMDLKRDNGLKARTGLIEYRYDI